MKTENKTTNQNQSQGSVERVSLRIDRVCDEGLLQEFNPEQRCRLGDFISYDFRRRILKELLGRDIQLCEIDGYGVTWQDTKQYASRLQFVLKDEMPLRYNATGHLAQPLHLTLGEHAANNLLRTLDASSLVYVACGAYVETEDVSSEDESRAEDVDSRGESRVEFHLDTMPAEGVDSLDVFHLDTMLADGVDSLDVLLAVKWGGADSNTRGLTESGLTEKARYFKKVTSNGGKEGIDYIVLPACEQPKYLKRAITRALEKQALAEKDFGRKWKRYQDYTSRYTKVQEESWDLLDEAIKLVSKCEQEPVAQLLFVETPKQVKLEKVAEWQFSPNDDLEAAKAVQKAEADLRETKNRLARKRIEVENWLEFAPKFARLQPQVVTNRGWMLVKRGVARVALPSVEATEEPYTITTYAFSDVRLNDLLADLEEYTQQNFAMRQENCQRLDGRPTIQELLERQEAQARKDSSGAVEETANADETVHTVEKLKIELE